MKTLKKTHGGGLLETNNQLERFTKNKRSKKLTYSIVGILLVVGSITLYNTFAFFEEKQEFNVIKGKIPYFVQNDLTLALTLDGQKVESYPEKGEYDVRVQCDQGAYGSWDYDKWGVFVGNLNNNKIRCQIDFKTVKSIFLYAQIGDYVSYTPNQSLYSISGNLTGCTDNSECKYASEDGTQFIVPSELNLWRVIKKNEDGSLDLVSENLSNNRFNFFGKEGVKNYIGTLNKVASSYETEGITKGSRCMGYNGQTEFIDVFDLFECSTGGSCVLLEEKGGGDNFYEEDVTLVREAIGNIKAVSVNHVDSSYFLASRMYHYNGENYYFYAPRFIEGDSVGFMDNQYRCINKECKEHDFSAVFRPIVTLKEGIYVNSGDGTSENPWKVN